MPSTHLCPNLSMMPRLDHGRSAKRVAHSKRLWKALLAMCLVGIVKGLQHALTPGEQGVFLRQQLDGADCIRQLRSTPSYVGPQPTQHIVWHPSVPPNGRHDSIQGIMLSLQCHSCLISMRTSGNMHLWGRQACYSNGLGIAHHEEGEEVHVSVAWASASKELVLLHGVSEGLKLLPERLDTVLSFTKLHNRMDCSDVEPQLPRED